MTRKIEIELDGDGGGGCYHTIRCGERWEEKLTTDEALYTIAVLLIKGLDAPGYLKTKEEHDARDRAWSKPVDTAVSPAEERT